MYRTFLRSLVGVFFFITGLTLSIGAADNGSAITGHWEGQINVPNQTLEILVDYTWSDSGGYAGTISIPAQNAKNLPLDDITVSGSQVRFVMPNIPGDPVFDEELSENGKTISGDYIQGGNTFTFTITSAVTPAYKAEKALKGFDGFVDQAIQDWNVPGIAIGIVIGDEIVYAKGFGYRNVDEELPVTPNTLFAIGSATKAFTTFTMATLVNEGALDWDTPVRDYLPGFRMYDPVATDLLTPRDLVTHRSGLPRHDLMWYNNKEYTREDYIQRLRYLEPNAELRQKFQYNNLMFLTAGYLTEQLTGETWEDAVRERVLNPLGMSSTNFSVVTSQQADDYAMPYHEKDDSLQVMPFRELTVLGPAGSINSSVNDMSQWLVLHLGNGSYDGDQLVSPDLVRDTHTPHMTIGSSSTRPEISTPAYGLGWFVNTYRGHAHVSHGGNIDGFTALVTLYPDDDIGIVALANKNGTGLPRIVTRHVADRLLELDPIDWNAEGLESLEKGEEAVKSAEEKADVTQVKNTVMSHALSVYTGEYTHPAYGTLVVDTLNSSLRFTYNDITTPLEHWHYNVFNGLESEDNTFESMKLMFRADLNGNIASIEAPFEPSVDNIVFHKKPSGKLSDPAYLDQLTGKYILVDDTVSVTLAGNRLKLSVPGQPTYTLLPDLGDKFHLKEYTVIQVSFTMDEQNQVTAINLDQPNGRFSAERVK